MADLSDVLNAIVSLIDKNLYPGGDNFSLQASPVTGLITKIFSGWPQNKKLDDDLKAGYVSISVFSQGGGGSNTPQLIEQPSIIAAPVHTITVSATNDTTPVAATVVATLGGTVTVGNYVTFVLDNKFSFSYAATNADTLTTMATALANLIKVKYPSVSSSGPNITLTGPVYVVIRVGAQGTMGLPVHRQKPPVRVMIWAPTPAARDVTATQVDAVLKAFPYLTFPDTSQGIMTYMMTSVDDVPEKANLFRRDLVYFVEYATVYTFPAYEITSVNITLDPGVDKTTPVAQ